MNTVGLNLGIFLLTMTNIFLFLVVFFKGVMSIPLKKSTIIYFGGLGCDCIAINAEAFSLGTVAILIAYILLFVLWKLVKDDEKERNEAKERENQEQFYRECRKNGVLSCTTDREIEKAKLIAQKYNLAYTSISELHNLAAARFEDKEAAARNERLRCIKEAESSENNALNRYAFYWERQKRIEMLSDMRREHLNAIEESRKARVALVQASVQAPKDWAIGGGLASGIAGPAAGLATALDIQRENAEIQRRNQQTLNSLGPVFSALMDNSNSSEEKARILACEIDAAKTKLVGKNSGNDCLARLSFTDQSVTVSETGTCTVSVNAKVKKAFCIFDDVPAVVDGTVQAGIYDGETRIGTATLVLPTYGLNAEAYAPLKGMCLFCGKQGRDYTLRFEAGKLWAMEK